MQVKARIDKSCETVEIHVCNKELNEQVKQLVTDISGFLNAGIMAANARGDKVLLPLKDVLRFYTENQRVMAQDAAEAYSTNEKLYELENRLDQGQFFRISRSEIVNLKKIRKLEMDMAGTIKVILSDGTETYTSRRNVTKLKQCLGIRGGAV